MRRTFKCLIVFMIICKMCIMNVSHVNAAYTKMWWEYIDEYAKSHSGHDEIYVNSSDVLCLDKYSERYYDYDTGEYHEKYETIELLNNVKDFYISQHVDTNVKVVLMSDGTLYYWNSMDSRNSIPQQILRDVVSLSCGYYHIGALCANGELVAIKYVPYDHSNGITPFDYFEMTDVKQFEFDNASYVILKNDGKLYINGYWTKENSRYFAFEVYKKYSQWQFLDENVKSFDVCCGNLAYIKTDGTMWMVGCSNYYGEMATPRALLSATFTPVKIADDVERISLDRYNTMYLKRDGSVYSVGYSVQSDVPQWISGKAIAIDFPYIWKRDGLILRLHGDEHREWIVAAVQRRTKVNDIYMPVVITYKNQNVSFDQEPIIDNGRVMVPLRAIFEAMGAEVEWEDSTQTVIANKDEKTVKLTVGDMKIYVSDSIKQLDVPAKLVNGRVLIPVRAVSEAFDCSVNWDDNTRTVIIE